MIANVFKFSIVYLKYTASAEQIQTYALVLFFIAAELVQLGEANNHSGEKNVTLIGQVFLSNFMII